MNESNTNNTNEATLKYFLSLENRARSKLINRYDKPLSYHDTKMINDILYNEKTRYVEAFKEYLIYEDYNEFLKRYYKSFEINIKLPKILLFYEKYSKIYANYTVIPESKYMYKNIKRKQKMIDQMQNNDINSEYEEDEESNEDISNTVFSSRVINSIYDKTLSSVNKSQNTKNTEQSINEFLEKINNIENNEKKKEKKINLNLLKLESNNNINNHDRIKMRNNFLINKDKTPQNKNVNNNINSNNNQNNKENKKIDIQINYKKKNSQKKNINPQNKNNLIQNANNKNYNNLIFINSYTCKTKNNINAFKNNFSIGNYINSCNNTFNNNTFSGNNYLRTNFNFPKQKLSSATFKQNIINSSNNNLTEQRENMNLTNINNYFNNVNNINNNQKYKLSLRETLFKLDKLILSTNVSNSPKILNENKFSTSSNKTNILNNKNNIKNSLLREKDKSESQKIKKDLKSKVQGLSHKILNAKKFRSNLLYHNYNSIGANLTFLSNNKYQDNSKVKNMFNKFSKKKNNSKYNEIISSNNKKPESHRNFYHSRVLSGNNSYKKNKSNKGNINNINSNSKMYKITVGNTKQGIKIDSKKINFPCSPSNSGSEFYFTNQITNRKHSMNKAKKTKLTKEVKKKKVVNNFNIVNNIHDNSTQINIFTGKDLYKSLRLQNKSLFNSTSISPSNISPKSPYQYGGVNIKNKKQININKNILENNANKNYIKSNIKGKEKPIKHNLDFKKIMNKQIIDNDKAIISERLMNNKNKKLFEKIGKYFFKNRKDKSNNNINNKNINNKKISYKAKSNNSNKNINYTKQKNNNEYTRLINKIVAHRFAKNKTNNNTPIKTRYIPCTTKNHIKAPSVGSPPTDYEQVAKVNKAPNTLNIKYNKIINNLNELKNFGLDDGNKLLIHSERNKISKIVFK